MFSLPDDIRQLNSCLGNELGQADAEAAIGDEITRNIYIRNISRLNIDIQ